MGKIIDLTGRQFGRLTVIKRAKNKGRSTAWECLCECGNETVVLSSHLKSNHTTSCGCFKKERILESIQTHGQAKGEHTRLYNIYHGIKKRCYKKSEKSYDHYGGRGITVCAEWQNDFQAFYDWAMANGYADNLTIDRIDVNGNYEPANCRWVDMKNQCNNRRNNHLITYNGKSQTIAQWAAEYGVKYKKLNDRINKLHWSFEKAISTP